MLAIVGVLILGREVEVVGIERFDSDERLVASGARRQFDEALAAPMLGGFGLALGDVGVARRVDVDLHHEGELRVFLLDFDQAGQNFFPSRAAEEIVVDQEQRLDAVIAASRRAPSRTTASGSRERIVRPITFFTLQYEQVNGHPREVSSVVIVAIEEARQIAIVEHRQLRLGDDRHDDVVLAGLGADAFGDRVVELQLAAQEILDDIAPQIFGLAHDGGDAAAVEELARLGIAADVEAAHHRGQALGDELQRRGRGRADTDSTARRPVRSAVRRRPRAPFP